MCSRSGSTGSRPAACARKQYDGPMIVSAVLQQSLQRHWDQLCSASQIAAALGAPALAELYRAYSEEHRHYHTLQHLEHMLGLVNDSGNAHPEALWATW